MARAVSLAALVVAVAALAVVLRGSGPPYRVNALFVDAGQLVPGNRVVVGGVPIGEVEQVKLDDRNRARVTLKITDDAFDPLHEGTRASIGVPSLSTQAGRFVSLHPGPNSAARLPDGGDIGAEYTEAAVELDALFNALDERTRSDLQAIVHGSADQFAGGRAAAANRGLEYLSPAVAQLRGLSGELLADQRAFGDLIVRGATVAGAVASRSGALQEGLVGAAAVTRRLAREDATIGDLLERAPDVLRRARGTLHRVDGALATARPALRLARPVAPRLASVLRLLAPVARGARPAVRDLRTLLPDAERALRGLPELERVGRLAFADTTGALRGTAPIVAAARPYTPDVVAGLINGFGGTPGAYYDANGRYAHIAFMLPPNFLVQGASIAQPIEELFNGAKGGGFLNVFPDYCPGGSTAPPPDGSAPFLDPAVAGHCDPGQTPRP
ncbi:MAG: MlaD family protein [Solirubrobacteraceae bacterium]